jgi:hypothetical protein
LQRLNEFRRLNEQTLKGIGQRGTVAPYEFKDAEGGPEDLNDIGEFVNFSTDYSVKESSQAAQPSK